MLIALYFLIGAFIAVNAYSSEKPTDNTWIIFLVFILFWPAFIVASVGALERDEWMTFLFTGVFKKSKKDNKPSTILVQMFCAEIIKELKVPSEFRGFPVERIKFGHAVYEEQRRYIPSYKIGDYVLTLQECREVLKIEQQVQSIRKKKEANDAEAARQHRALDIICGTSSKHSTEELPKGLTKDMRSTCSISLGDVWIPNILQVDGETLTAYQFLKDGGTYFGKNWDNLKTRHKMELLREHQKVPLKLLAT